MSAFESGNVSINVKDGESGIISVVDPSNVPKVLELRSLLPSEVSSLFSDHECERFLIARKFDIKKTIDLLLKRAEWYATPFTDWKVAHPQLRPCDLLTYVDEKDPLFAQYGFNSYLWEDLDGDPIYWEKSGLATSKWDELSKQFTADESVLRHIQQMEIITERIRRCRVKSGRLVTKQTVVMDMKHLPMMPNFSSIAVIRRVMEIDESKYPEILKRVLLINVPTYAQVIFRLITPFIDAATQAKFKAAGSDFFPLLQEFIAVDKIPLEYGGTCADFSWNFPNNVDFMRSLTSSSESASAT